MDMTSGEERRSDEEREVQAARNQAVFRAMNERLRVLNEAFPEVTETFTVACECANLHCIEQLDIAPGEYEEVRANPRQSVVLPGHVVPDVEQVIGEAPGYVVVEKTATAGDVAERLLSGGD
jgi:hypothetical protein